jgi:hypothetical protein
MYPTLDFWFENKPSGNPGYEGIVVVGGSLDRFSRKEFGFFELQCCGLQLGIGSVCVCVSEKSKLNRI